jgi:hypothetical protein
LREDFACIASEFVRHTEVAELLFKTNMKLTRIAAARCMRCNVSDASPLTEPGSTKYWKSHMNAKLVISALVAALALSACAKQEEAAAPAEAPAAEAPAAEMPAAEAPAAEAAPAEGAAEAAPAEAAPAEGAK